MTLNLNPYDKVENQFNNKTWINPKYKKLYSKEIEFKPYYSFLQRYNKNSNTYDYYVIFSNVQYDDINWHSTTTNKNKAITINLSSIWNKSTLNRIKTPESISLIKKEEDKDSVIYYIDV